MSQIRPGPMPVKLVKQPKERKPWKRKSRLKQVGDKLRASLAIYHNVTKPAWLALHSRCQFVLTPGASCGEKFGVVPHHKKRRGKYLNDPRYLMTVCREHHDWIENHKNQARAMGYILYK